eukprot:CAMPEP_0194549042 /NCGR_PEP_ID=MMETSP0253-20130528/94597_1 /TAXON_ID=2966 /ORGANISM="Noctiluca scintillans" /LENGTH=45 /DNA_ID= /DNA_START= /DNA_END= /DNA_ORIENTATION=
MPTRSSVAAHPSSLVESGHPGRTVMVVVPRRVVKRRHALKRNDRT